MKAVDSSLKAFSVLPDRDSPARRAFVPNVLSIAGSDASGGAGIQADLKTVTAFGAYACAVITAITEQNASRVTGVHVLDAGLVRRQLDAVLSGLTIHTVKIGMLGGADVAKAVAAGLRNMQANIVVDPVIRSTSGATLLSADAVEVLRSELFPLAFVVTPNASEAGALLGEPPPASVKDMQRMARRLHRFGSRWVVITGGHVGGPSDPCIDVAYDGTRYLMFETPRVAGVDPHGAGCTYSSAVAALLGQACTPSQAFAIAQNYVSRAIAASATLEAKPGRRPLRHVPFDVHKEYDIFATAGEELTA